MEEEKDVKDVAVADSVDSSGATAEHKDIEKDEGEEEEQTVEATPSVDEENVEIASGAGDEALANTDELKERILEIEDLQMLLEAEMVKLKEYLLEKGEKLDLTQEKKVKDLEKKVKALEEKVNSIGARGQTPEAVSEGILQKIEEKIKRLPRAGVDEERLKGIESKIEALKQVTIKRSQPETGAGVVEGLKKDIALLKQSYQSDNKHIVEQLEKLATDIENLKKMYDFSKATISDIENLKKDMAGLKDEIQTELKKDIIIESRRIDKTEKAVEQQLAEAQSKINKIEELVESSGKMLTKKGMDMFLEKIRAARAEMKKDYEELNRSREMVNQLIMALGKIKDKADTADVTLQKAEASITRMQTIEEKVNNDIRELAALDKSIKEKFAKIDEKITEIEKISNDVEATKKVFEDKMRNNIKSMTAISDTMNGRLGVLDKRLQTAEQLADHVRSKVDQLSAIESRVNQIKNDFDKKAAAVESFRAAIEEKSKSLDQGLQRISAVQEEIENKSKVNEEKLMAYVDNMNALKDAIYAKIDSLNQLTMGAEQVQTRVDKANELVNKIETLGSSIDNKVKRLDSAMHDIDEIKARLSSQKPSEKVEERIKKDLDNRIVSLVTKNLEKFAETLDRKLPDLVTKDDLKQLSIPTGPVRASTPAARPAVPLNIENKISQLEQKISDIETRIAAMASSSGAFVIE